MNDPICVKCEKYEMYFQYPEDPTSLPINNETCVFWLCNDEVRNYEKCPYVVKDEDFVPIESTLSEI